MRNANMITIDCSTIICGIRNNMIIVRPQSGGVRRLQKDASFHQRGRFFDELFREPALQIAKKDDAE